MISTSRSMRGPPVRTVVKAPAFTSPSRQTQNIVLDKVFLDLGIRFTNLT